MSNTTKLLNIIQNHLEQSLRNQQAGFRTNRTCADHIVTLHTFNSWANQRVASNKNYRVEPWNRYKHLEEPGYEDDIALLCIKRSVLQSNLNQLSSVAVEVSFKINVRKTEFVSNIADSDSPDFTIYGEEINRNTELCYFGSKITTTDGNPKPKPDLYHIL